MLRTTLRLGASNVYLLKTGDTAAAGGSLIAVDAGPDYEGAWQQALAQLEDAGLAPGDVGAVLVTHGHVDHCALASYWQREAGAETWIGAADAERMRHGGREPERDRELALDFLAASGVPAEIILHTRGRRAGRTRAVPSIRSGHERLGNLRSVAAEHGDWPGPLLATPAVPDRVFDARGTLSFGGLSLQPILCPGHTPASAVVLDDHTGDLYTGDHVLERIAPTPGIHFDGAGERIRSLPQYLRSLNAIRDLRVGRVLPGHGEPFEDLAGAVDRTALVFEQRATRLLRRLRQQPDTAWGLAHRLYPHLRPAAVWVALAEIAGLLDLLEERGAIILVGESPRIYRSVA